jgi:hypothetical protein
VESVKTVLVTAVKVPRDLPIKLGLTVMRSAGENVVILGTPPTAPFIVIRFTPCAGKYVPVLAWLMDTSSRTATPGKIDFFMGQIVSNLQ